MIQSILSGFWNRTNRTIFRRDLRIRRVRLEQLEDRRLLSISAVSDIAGLRAALDTFNGTSDDDTINVAAGTYTLSGARLDNANASGDLDITKTGGSLTIQGAGTGSTYINANDVDRVFHITGATTVTLADLTIQNGSTDDNGTSSGQAFGGGILISGAADVTLSNVAVTSNTATGLAGVSSGSAGQDAYGGGIAIVNASASLALTNTTMTGNTALGGAGQTGTSGVSWTNGQTGGQGGAARGGAVSVANGDVVIAGTSSLTGNSATGGTGGTGGKGGFTTFAGWMGAAGGVGGNASGGGAFVSGGSLSVPLGAAITGNGAMGGQGGNGGPGGTSMSTGPQGVGGAGGSANGGGTYFTDGNMAAIQSGAIASNSVTAGTGGSGSSAGSNGSSDSADAGRQASVLSVTIEQAGGQADSASSQPVYFTVTFSESVSNFATGDVTIGGTTGATTASVSGSGTTYTVAVSGLTSDGWLSTYVAAGVATNAGAAPNGASYSDDNVVVLSGGDYAAPTINNTTPADNATGIDPTANLSITFDENVAKGTGNISVYDSGDTLVEAIDVTSGQVTVSGATITINPTNALADLTSYYVQIDATAIDDTSGNSFAGISDKTTWSFTTADTTSPTIDSTTPADNTIAVDPTANLSITFDENVANGTGNISIYDSTDTLFEAIVVTSGQVTVSGATVTINPTGTLADLTSYYVQIDATAIDDTSGNSFAGISDKTTWSFTTADTTSPTIDSTTPADNTTAVDPTANLSITFDENVAKGTGNISVYDSGDTLVEAIDVTSGQVTVSGATITINPTNALADLTSYYVQIDATAIDDTSGNSFAGISDKTTWSFTTADFAVQATDLGTVDYRRLSDLVATGVPYYFFETTYNGQLSLLVDDSSSGTTTLELFDHAEASLATDATRIDWDVAAGEAYYFRLAGTATSVDVTIVNLIDDTHADLVVHGTSGDDEFAFRVGVGTDAGTYVTTVNGIDYQVATSQLTSISFDGGDGNDSAEVTGTDGDDYALLSPHSAVLTTDSFTAIVTDVNTIIVTGGEGSDMAEMTDSAGDDTFTASVSQATMSGSGYSNSVRGFEQTHGYARGGGADVAQLHDTAGDDEFKAWAGYGAKDIPIAKLRSATEFVRTKFFSATRAYATSGADEAIFIDSSGDDHFAGGPGLSTMTANHCTQSAAGFDVVHAYAHNGGTDMAELTDSAGDDRLVATNQFMKLFGDGFFVRAKFFEQAHGYARNGGNDSALLYGTAEAETYRATPQWGKLIGSGYLLRAKFFDSVKAVGKGGNDRAYLYDSPENDFLDATPTTATLTTPTSREVVQDFDWVRASSENGGTDINRTEAVDFALGAVGDWLRE